MIFTATFKTPDVLENTISDIVKHDTYHIRDLDEREATKEVITSQLTKFAQKWVRYGEYITVEFDTEKGTCKVLGG